MNNPHRNARLTVHGREQIEARARQPAFGPVLPLASEAEFETETVCAAVYGCVLRLVQVTADWSAGQGLPEATARQLAALTTEAAGRNLASGPGSVEDLLAELENPGGITETGLALLESRGVSAAWEEACARVAARLSGRG